MALDDLIATIRRSMQATPGEHHLRFDAGAVPFVVPASLSRSAPVAPEAGAPGTRAEGEPASDDGSMAFTCTGTASSTSVDWYGTEMSRDCLGDMAEQFTHGVGVFVGHGGLFGDGMEWDNEIGHTTGATVEDAEVVNAHRESRAEGEPGAVCKVEMAFECGPRSSERVTNAVRALADRLRKGRPLGLSIGGWFRDATYLINEAGELYRIIINKVDLDHLATTRRPANPDCLDMAMVGRAMKDGLAAQRAAAPAGEPRAAEPATTPATPAASSAPPEPSAPSQRETPDAGNVREIDDADPKLSDSEYEQPPHDYVLDLRENWPDIWSAGGNERGNEAFDLWTRALDGDDATVVKDWIKEREAWAARHEGDFLLPGVVAQLKWGVVGRRGWDHQREVVEARKEELSDEETGDEGSVEDAASPATETRGTPSFADLPLAEEAPAFESASAPSSTGGTSPDNTARSVPPAASTTTGHAGEEIDMTPQELDAVISRMLAERGLVLPTKAATDLDAGDNRTGRADPPQGTALTPPAGADVMRSKVLLDRAGESPSNGRTNVAPTLRSTHFGEDPGASNTQADPLLFRAPSTQRRRAMWLGLAHNLRAMGASDELAQLAEDAVDVVSYDLVNARNKDQAEAMVERVRQEAPELLLRSLRAAVGSSHPVFKEPGQREAIARSLTVSNASDKVTTALVSSLLQQLSNLQLGARTQMRRIPGAGTNYQTPKRTVSSTLAEWLADGTAPTEDSGALNYDTWSYKTIGTRFRVTRKAQAQGRQWGDLIASELLNKGEDFNRQEEVTIFQGDADNSLPTANAPNGLLTLIASANRVANTSATAGDTLSLQKLDEAISKVRGRENKANMRIFASERGHILLNAVLQAQQQFSNVTMIQAGFVVQTYNGIAIVESSGIPDTMVWGGSQILKWTTGATTALVVVNLQHAYLVVLTPMTVEQVGTTTAQYQDFEMFADEAIVLDNSYGASYLGGILVS